MCRPLTYAGWVFVVCLLAGSAVGDTTQALTTASGQRPPGVVGTGVDTAATGGGPGGEGARGVAGRGAGRDAATCRSRSTCPDRSGGDAGHGGTGGDAALGTGPIFNTPVGGTRKQDAIAAHVARLIGGAPAKAVISVAMYHFSSLDTAARLIAASRRKVAVHVVLDNESVTSLATRRLRKALGGDTGKRSWAVVCPADRGCIGSDFNHNKFFLFSSTLGASDVVLQTSANSTDGARDTQWNDALTIRDAGAYAAYLSYFGDLTRQRRDDDYHRVVRTGGYRIDFFPWRKGDPISQALDRVSCAGGTRLRLSVGHFTWGPIARRLWKLDDAGCRVQVVFDRVGPVAIHALTKKGGRHGNAEIRYLTETARVYAHSKYLLIDGSYEGRPQKVVFTGSNNYTTVGFHSHDEAMITIADPRLEERYAANFADVFAKGHAVSPTDPNSLPRAALDITADRPPDE